MDANSFVSVQSDLCYFVLSVLNCFLHSQYSVVTSLSYLSLCVCYSRVLLFSFHVRVAAWTSILFIWFFTNLKWWRRVTYEYTNIFILHNVAVIFSSRYSLKNYFRNGFYVRCRRIIRSVVDIVLSVFVSISIIFYSRAC